jgi:hypothetical protein
VILLVSTTDKLQVVTTTTANIDVHASFTDYNGSVVTPGRTNSNISTATTTDVVASPGASVQRNVKSLVVKNTHATASNTVTVRHTDGTIVVQLIRYTLLAAEQLLYFDKDGFVIIDAAGGRKTAPMTGRYLGSTVKTTGTTFTTGLQTNSIFVRLMAGGGAGGGCTSVASSAGAGGGGSAGGYAEKTFAVLPNTAYTCAIGLGGTGVSGAAGNAGGNTTFTVGGVTVTANGGLGGTTTASAATLTASLGGAAPAVSTNGDLNSSGEPGGVGIVLIVATPILASGKGGSSQLGPGANGITAVGNGPAAPVGFGGGGGGAATGASTVRTGGDGAPGVIIVDEFA